MTHIYLCSWLSLIKFNKRMFKLKYRNWSERANCKNIIKFGVIVSAPASSYCSLGIPEQEDPTLSTSSWVGCLFHIFISQWLRWLLSSGTVMMQVRQWRIRWGLLWNQLLLGGPARMLKLTLTFKISLSPRGKKNLDSDIITVLKTLKNP